MNHPATARDAVALPLPVVSPVTVPVAGRGQPFTVRRIYCVGRNYIEHIREMKEGDERDRRSRANAGHAPAEPEERGTDHQRRVDMGALRQVKARGEEGRRPPSGEPNGNEHHDDRRGDDEGETRVPAAAWDRAEIEEAQNLQRIDHLRHVKAGAEQQAAAGGRRQIR